MIRRSPAYRVRLLPQWPEEAGQDLAPGATEPALMIALHARRSAASVAAWRARHPRSPLLLALTGTDLYRDIASDAAAQRSLQLADRLLVLNEQGCAQLPVAQRHKCLVLLQSCPARRPLAAKPRRWLRALMVGHLRAEKDPQCFFAAVRQLAGRADLRFDHIGAALEPALGAAARALQAQLPQYRWLGGLAHGEVRRRIQAAHLLVHPSRMEGGAHVLIEAMRSGTPVLASRIPGNTGLLGEDYAGLFEPGDAAGLAALITRARDDATMLPALQRQIAARAPLFAPEAEAAALLALLQQMLAPDSSHRSQEAP